jgi:hypothetical protein
MDWLAQIPSVVGSLGTLLSIVALIQVGRVKSHVRRVERESRQRHFLPKYAVRLRSHVKNITTYLDQKNRQKAAEETGRLLAVLQSTKGLLSESLCGSVSDVIQRLQGLRSRSKTMFLLDLRATLPDLVQIQHSIENYSNELPWRETDEV